MQTLLHFILLVGPTAAIIYIPSFTGGTGCNSAGLISNDCPTTTAARQATNGAGGYLHLYNT